MKILVLQDFLRSGGTERQSILLSRGFTEADHTTRLITMRPGGKLAEGIEEVDHRPLQAVDLRLDWFAPGLVRKARAMAPDIILCMGRIANCYAGSLQKSLPAAAVVTTMRTGRPLPWLFRRSLRLSAHTIANSDETRGNLVRLHGVPREKISVIYNSLVFPPESALQRNSALRAELGVRSGTKVLLSVAMFRPEKNQRELVEICAGLPGSLDWQLWLAGEGEARGECERLVARKKLGARVKFLGFHRNPTPLYLAADIAVHTSLSDSLSNFLIEAQAHGLPVVAYKGQGIAECFLPDDTGWVVALGDRSIFRKRIRRLSSDTDGRADRALRARAFARIRFNPVRQVAAYLDLFAKLKIEANASG